MKNAPPVSAFEMYKKLKTSNGHAEGDKKKFKAKLNQTHKPFEIQGKKLKYAAQKVLDNEASEQVFVTNKKPIGDNKITKKKKRNRNKQSLQNSTNSVSSTVTSNGSFENLSKGSFSLSKFELSHNGTSETEFFQWLISPISINTFFNQYWETNYLHVKRSKSKYYSTLLNSSTLDQMIRENSLYYTKNVDVVYYEDEKKEVVNPEGKATPVALWDYYQNGCSIRILNPQSYNNKLHLLVTTLQEFFGSMVGINVYLTPPGSQGFAPHFDDIEAFVLQLEGRKHWKLYKPSSEDTLARFSSKNFKHEEIGEPFFDGVIEAGDLLYFPRGTIHEAETDKDSHSLHITVSTYQNNAYIDLFESVMPLALAKSAKENIEFRRGLPFQFLHNAGFVNKDNKNEIKKILCKNINELSKKLVDNILENIDNGVDQLGKKLMYDSMPHWLTSKEEAKSFKEFGDVLKDGKVLNKLEISSDMKIRLVKYHSIRLAMETDNFRLYYCTENSMTYHGEEEQWLEIDENMTDAVKLLQNTYPNTVKVSELPLTDDSRNQFVLDLWEKGIVIFDDDVSC